jgi:hypothetical protein
VDDVFQYAEKVVENKGVLARMAHSAKLHSVRSAVSSPGSAASKGAALMGAGLRATVNAIPIPVIGGLIGAVEARVEKAIKSRMHRSHLKPTASKAETVKFTLKELSVEELDRYRWKVSEAITEFNKLLAQKDATLKKNREAHSTCECFVDLAIAAEQVKRRIRILRQACLGLFAAVKITSEWIMECEKGSGATPFEMVGGSYAAGAAMGGVTKGIKELADWIAATIKFETDNRDAGATEEAKAGYILQLHGKCERWCCFRDRDKPDTWANFREKSAYVLRNLADPFVPDSFNNNLGVLWKESGS